MMASTGFGRGDIVLVGRELPGDENLGVRYVASALIAAGRRVSIEPLNEIDDIVSMADRIVSAQPALVGLSIGDSLTAIRSLSPPRCAHTPPTR
jgi:hypothetical protein